MSKHRRILPKKFMLLAGFVTVVFSTTAAVAVAQVAENTEPVSSVCEMK